MSDVEKKNEYVQYTINILRCYLEYVVALAASPGNFYALVASHDQ